MKISICFISAFFLVVLVGPLHAAGNGGLRELQNNPTDCCKTTPVSCTGAYVCTSGNGCFAATAKVQVLNKGEVAMKDLTIGDQVLTSSAAYEPVYALGHDNPTKKAEFLKIHTTAEAHPLEITDRHLLFVEGKANPVRADSIKVGDVLRGNHDTQVTVSKIQTVTRSDGIYAPLTPSGSIMVDGIQASTYVALQTKGGNEYPEFVNGVTLPVSQHFGIHMGSSIFRMMCMGVSSSFCASHDDDGLLWWAGYGMRLAEYLEETSVFTQLIALVLALACAAPIFAMEVLFGARYAPLIMAAGFIGLVVSKKHGISLGFGKKVKTV